MKTERSRVIRLAAALATGFLAFIALGAQQLPKASFPILTTSAGQSTDVETLNIVMEEAGLGFDYCDVPTTELLAAGVGLAGKESAATGFHVEVHTDLAKYPQGTAYKTVIFALGASMKGMGASGLTLEGEEARLKQILDYCRKNKLFTIAVHLGGEARRGAPGSDNERMIDAVAPFVDYIIITKDSNKDGRFTKIAADRTIPLTEIEFALGLVDTLKQVFQ